MATKKIDMVYVPAMTESANSYRAACDQWEAVLEDAKEKLMAAHAAVIEAVAQCREMGIDITDPFDHADPVGRAFNTVLLHRHEGVAVTVLI